MAKPDGFALAKPDGGVRGIVARDVIRRLTARTMAQHLGKAVEACTAPFQYALSTKAGCECIPHTLQALCELNPEATVISVDGISAFDLVSRTCNVGRSPLSPRWSGSIAVCSHVFMVNLPDICGRMRRGLCTPSIKEKEASKETC